MAHPKTLPPVILRDAQNLSSCFWEGAISLSRESRFRCLTRALLSHNRAELLDRHDKIEGREQSGARRNAWPLDRPTTALNHLFSRLWQ